MLEGDYVSGGDDLIRTEPLDCKVGSSDAACDGDPDGTAGTGGYTYGDFGKIIGRPEVHADGEIWSQTLWDLRDALGSNTVEGIVTRAMELAPSNPSFLDMRNSILQADLVATGGVNHDTIWSTFAHRGMGYFAGAVDGDDAFPVENFTLPPTSKTFGKLHGKVLDADTNLPIVGASVLFGGHASGFPDDIAGITDEFGVYDIKKVLVGTYPKVWATAPGYDRQVLPSVAIPASAVKIDWKLKRNWASLAGGGSIDSFTGPNYGPHCPPEGAIDDSAGVGWGSDTDVDATSTGQRDAEVHRREAAAGREYHPDVRRPVEHVRRPRKLVHPRLPHPDLDGRNDVHDGQPGGVLRGEPEQAERRRRPLRSGR